MCQEVSLPTLEAMGWIKSHKRPEDQSVLAEVSGCRKAIAPRGAAPQPRRGPCNHPNTNIIPPTPSPGGCWSPASGSLFF